MTANKPHTTPNPMADDRLPFAPNGYIAQVNKPLPQLAPDEAFHRGRLMLGDSAALVRRARWKAAGGAASGKPRPQLSPQREHQCGRCGPYSMLRLAEILLAEGLRHQAVVCEQN